MRDIETINVTEDLRVPLFVIITFIALSWDVFLGSGF